MRVYMYKSLEEWSSKLICYGTNGPEDGSCVRHPSKFMRYINMRNKVYYTYNMSAEGVKSSIIEVEYVHVCAQAYVCVYRC